MKKTNSSHYSLIHEMYTDLMLYEIENLKKGLMKDITINEIHTIEHIGHMNQGTMREIADCSRVRQSTMTVMIDKLIRKGMVERCRSENDRRVVLVRLTEKGEMAHLQHDKLHKKVSKKWLDLLSEEEQRQLLSILNKITDGLT
jgi:DNA-binding MarR family transcriptional regulator